MTSSIDAHVGDRVRQSRILKGMTQKELGKAVGVRFQQIQKYEAGKNRIGAGRLWELAKTLDVSVTKFYEGLGEVSGMAESEEDYTQLASNREALELIREFYRVSPKVRRRLMELIRQIARTPSPDDDTDPPASGKP